MRNLPKPTKADLLAANGRTITDVIAPNLRVLFCGINPGLYTAAIGHHFGRPGNRFWPTLHAAGFTPRLFDPSEEQALLPLGLGITNVVARATPGMDTLKPAEYVAGALVLRRKIRRFKPQVVVLIGVTVFRSLSGEKGPVRIGLQQERLEGARVFVLPNPSGRNANFSYAEMLTAFKALRRALRGRSRAGL